MKKLILTTALITGAMLGSLQAQDTFTRDQINAMIKEYIQNNPEIILDSVESYGRGQQAAEAERRQQAIEDHLSWLEGNKMLPVAGNPEGDITVVEFFDYNCGYCKKALDDVLTLLETDKDVRFVFVETPILGRMSEIAARWAVAAQQQDAYLEYHIGLMKNRGPLTEETLEKVGKNIGLDVVQLRKDAESKEVIAKVTEKSQKANQMGVSGTPAFVIGGQLYGGYIGLDRMRQAVADARANADEG